MRENKYSPFSEDILQNVH